MQHLSTNFSLGITPRAPYKALHLHQLEPANHQISTMAFVDIIFKVFTLLLLMGFIRVYSSEVGAGRLEDEVPMPLMSVPTTSPSPALAPSTWLWPHVPAAAPTTWPHAPALSPTHPQPQAPAAAPSTASHAPAPTPAGHPVPDRGLVAVQGVVYCKSCKFTGVHTLLGATPLTGAVVRLQCNNSRTPQTEQATTDKNGYFFLHPKFKVSNYGIHKCKAFLVSSPLQTCKNATDLHLGQTGASLRYQGSPKPSPFVLFTVGPFAFEPTSCPPA